MTAADRWWPLPLPSFDGDGARREALAGRVAVITGASRGLGAGMAAHFAAAGMVLGLCARERPPPPGAGAPPDCAPSALTAAFDVTDAEALESFTEDVVARFGRIDLWVNNAAVLSPIGPLADAAPDELARHVAVNVTGVALGSRLFARHVRARGGTGVLVNLSSGAARRPYEGWAPYCATKSAVDMLTEVLALEGAPWGLRAHAVAPGVVDTDMQVEIRATSADRFPEVERFHAFERDGVFNSPGWVAERLLELAFADAAVAPVLLRIPAQPVAPQGR